MTQKPFLRKLGKAIWISNQATGALFQRPQRSVSHEWGKLRKCLEEGITILVNLVTRVFDCNLRAVLEMPFWVMIIFFIFQSGFLTFDIRICKEQLIDVKGI